MGSGEVQLQDLGKDFGQLTAVDELSFTIDDGEFFTFLGPSGCGKTTTLRMIAGFVTPTRGTVSIGGERVDELPPYKREVGMVFQDYALFPHKTVGENIGFGLKMEGIPQTERTSRIDEMLELVNLPGFEGRSPEEISGGQQQRVALARALIIEPDVLLLDEPLANLDRKLRQQMRFELQRIQSDLGITTIYVTHDQEEALSMSDRILVMNQGQEEQIDSPRNLYQKPRNEFVANFIGETNLLQGIVKSVDDEHVTIELEFGEGQTFELKSPLDTELSTGADITINIRPEDIEVNQNGRGKIPGTVVATTFYGRVTTYLINVEGQEILVDEVGSQNQLQFDNGDQVSLNWDLGDCLVVSSTQ